MERERNEKSVIIIGAGFAGLSAGIYGQMNGYKTTIFEMHNKPGGLCTSWKRKGYTIDGCIHWLVGSDPNSTMHDYWEEVGLIQGRECIYMDEYMHYECPDGRVITFHRDINKLEKHLIEFSPQDEAHIKEFISGIRLSMHFNLPSKNASFFERFTKQLGLYSTFITKGKQMQHWMKVTGKEFAEGFKDPDLRNAFSEIWIPEFSILFMFFTFAYLNAGNAGYPIGGSMPMSMALEERYKALGGTIVYNSRVTGIITENDKAAGVVLENGEEYRSEIVISAADGYTTIFKMLGGRYADEKIRYIYDKWIPFHPLILIGMGVNRRFDEIPLSVSGFSFPLKEEVVIADKKRTRLPVHLYHHDPSLAPRGRTVLTIMLETGYDFWKELHSDKAAYENKKDEISGQVIDLLEQRFPGIKSQVEMVDVSTPMTFERYTGNWKGSFEGWLITPENSNTIMKPMSQTLPGLENFYMCGQWVEPGGGLPTGVISAKRLFRTICKKDGKKFIVTNA
jgi:phytoene dehydrogenase-like protein